MRVSKQCLVCEKTFETGGKGNPSHKVVYCSRECAAVARGAGLRREPEHKTCPVCQTVFLVGGRGNKPLGTRYCSPMCATAALKMPEIPKAPRSGKLGRPPKSAKITKACKQCSKEFEKYEWEDGAEYCSRECFYKSRIGRKNLHAVREPDKKQCENCGETFLVGGVGRPHRHVRFCSKTCAKQFMWNHKEQEVMPHTPARLMAEGECMWLAGLFDGEGCVAWPRRHIHHSVRLTLPNTNRAILDKIVEVTNTGRINEYNRKGNLRHSQTWGWHCYGENARTILRQIYPWLIIKKEAAAVALGLVKVEEPPWTQRTRSTRAAENMP